MKISNYKMVASNGKPIRTATQVEFNGQTIRFTERMSKRSAIAQVIGMLEHSLAVAIHTGDKAGEQKFTKALEMALNATDFPKISA